MNAKVFGTLVLTGLTSLVISAGCGSDDSSTDTAAATTSTASSTSTSNASSSASTGGGSDATTTSTGAGTCAQGLDTACEQCGAAKCMSEALACADESSCDANGEPTSGCLALVNCAALQCNADLTCVLDKCAKELESAGGIAGAGTAAAQALGTCVQSNCEAECLGAGGAGGAG